MFGPASDFANTRFASVNLLQLASVSVQLEYFSRFLQRSAPIRQYHYFSSHLSVPHRVLATPHECTVLRYSSVLVRCLSHDVPYLPAGMRVKTRLDTFPRLFATAQHGIHHISDSTPKMTLGDCWAFVLGVHHLRRTKDITQLMSSRLTQSLLPLLSVSPSIFRVER